jgi:hypothetical protein
MGASAGGSEGGALHCLAGMQQEDGRTLGTAERFVIPPTTRHPVTHQARCNSELLKNLGNFVNRTLMFVAKFCDGVVPAPHPTKGQDQVAELGALVDAKVGVWGECLAVGGEIG